MPRKPSKPTDATPLELALLDMARAAFKADIRSSRQSARNLLRDGSASPLGESSRKYLGQLLATEEPLAPAFRSPAASAAGSPRPIAAPPAEFEEATTSLVDVENEAGAQRPVFDEGTERTLQRFIAEREQAHALREAGVPPSSKLLLYGLPGVGKTMAAQWLASELAMPLIRAQPAAIMSSLLGQSARNLRQVLSYAAAAPCVLLLDEFDAYARRRDDAQDIAEPKRFVNTLLLELERWPDSSVLVAATNHEDLLDPALQRRFDLRIKLELPDEETRKRILEFALGEMGHRVDPVVCDAIAHATEGTSPSDLAAGCRAAIRTHVLDGMNLERAVAEALIAGRLEGRGAEARDAREHFAHYASGSLGLSHRDIGAICGVSHVAIGDLLRARRDRIATETSFADEAKALTYGR